tara:strand:+ start:366 stop:830 length:465 start_codon:yes stop_codon:yes gene_type:complete
MARVTVEDCLQQVENQYDLVLLAKERTFQLISGSEPLVPKNNDKRTVIALREIAEKKVSINDLEYSAVNKLRKYPEGEEDESDDLSDVEDDEFQKIYKGQVSKSGMAVLPSKRSRNTPNNLALEKNLLKETKTDVENKVPDTDQTEESQKETTK